MLHQHDVVGKNDAMATKYPYSDLTKLTAHFYEPMYAAFDQQMAAALLRRDAFLDKVIAIEIPYLREDLKGNRQSDKAYRHISRELKKLGGQKAPPLKQVSLSIRHTTAEALRGAVEEHNLVRDAFLNLLITLLRSSDAILDALDLPKRVGSVRSTEDMPTSSLRAIEEAQSDPLYYLRAGCEARHGCGIYKLPLPTAIQAFSCYLADDQVPGTSAYKERLETEHLILSVDLGARQVVTGV